jgi:hypothetical protein
LPVFQLLATSSCASGERVDSELRWLAGPSEDLALESPAELLEYADSRLPKDPAGETVPVS